MLADSWFDFYFRFTNIFDLLGQHYHYQSSVIKMWKFYQNREWCDWKLSTDTFFGVSIPSRPTCWKLVVNLEVLVDFGAGVIGDSVQSQNISFSISPLTAKQKLLLRLDDVCFFVTSSFLRDISHSDEEMEACFRNTGVVPVPRKVKWFSCLP